MAVVVELVEESLLVVIRHRIIPVEDVVVNERILLFWTRYKTKTSFRINARNLTLKCSICFICTTIVEQTNRW